MARSFTHEQREVIFELSGGACASCGSTITFENFHADHVHPYSMGGETNLSNAQALCAACNLRKGSNVTTTVAPLASPAPIKLRDWQDRCLNDLKRVVASGGKDYFLDVVTGAGKTFMGLTLGEYMLKANPNRILVVVTPSCAVRSGWVDEADKLGLTLRPVIDVALVKLLKGSGGFAITYDAFRQPDAVNTLLSIATTTELVVLFDEVHHASDNNEWGKAAVLVGSQSALRVGLSGTMFRTDTEEKIPYLPYDISDTSVPHFEYSYKEALEDGAISPLTFRPFNGSLETFDPVTGLKRVLSFDMKDMSDEECALLMRAATDPAHNFFRTLITEADQSLRALRAIDATLRDGSLSSGLLVAKDIEAANRAADYIRNVLGYRANQVMVVTSDDAKAQENIQLFKKDMGKKFVWLVSCGMVSEGVSIDHIRVEAYLTTKRTELAVKQAVGRLVRPIKSARKGFTRTQEDQMGFVFMPALPEFIRVAEQLDKITRHVLGPIINQPVPGQPTTRACPTCGTHNAPGQKTCSTCGTPLVQASTNSAGHIVMTCDAAASGLRVINKRGEIIQVDQETMDDIIAVRCDTPVKKAELAAKTATVWVASQLTLMVDMLEFMGIDIAVGLDRVRNEAKQIREKEAA